MASVRALRAVGLILAAFSLAACSLIPGTSPDPRAAALQSLAARQAQWAALAVADYEYDVVRQCFCPESRAHVTVRGGAFLSASRDGQPVPAEELRWLPTTIPGAFALIREVLTTSDRDASVSVDYDAARGYPARIAVDPIPNAVDDEYTIVIEGLVVGESG